MKVLIVSIFFMVFMPSVIAQINLPNDLEIDVDHYYLKALNIKQIIQSHSHKFKDSTYFRPEYVVDLDTLGRIKSFKYDFNLDLRTLKFDGVTIDFVVKDSSGLFQYDSLWYNFYKNNYIYEGNVLKSIHIVEPIHYPAYGVLDGVYVRGFSDIAVEFHEKTFYENNKISKIEKYDDRGLYAEIEYFYKKYELKYGSVFMLTKIVRTQRKSFIGFIGAFDYEETEIRIEYII